MNYMHDFHYVTAEEYWDKIKDDAALRADNTLESLKKLANSPDTVCDNCENVVWKAVGLGMCFTCVTGETDASEDLELITS